MSRTTVSHVLNNQPGINLSPKTKERVLAIARKLGYVPNSAAQMLVTGRSRCIGLVFSRADLLAVDAFVAIMIYGLNEVCRERGYRLVMEAIQESPGDDAYSNLAKSKRVDSLIVINPRKGDIALQKAIKSKFPVLIAGTAERPGENAISTQEDQASCQITNHLISLGHQRIAHISYASLDYVAAYRRLEGYRFALETANLPFNQALVSQGDFTFESGYYAMKQIFASNPRPTALFAAMTPLPLERCSQFAKQDFRFPKISPSSDTMTFPAQPMRALPSPPSARMPTNMGNSSRRQRSG